MAQPDEKKLNDIQESLDEMYIDYLNQEFEIKLAHHKRISRLLEERDAHIQSSMNQVALAEFYKQAFTNFGVVQDFLPLGGDGAYDATFIKSFTAEYLDEGRLQVTLEMHENDYVKNSVLKKTVYLKDKEPEYTKVEWKNEPCPCIMFNFFELDEDCYELFDLIYELYVNLVAYHTLEE